MIAVSLSILIFMLGLGVKQNFYLVSQYLFGLVARSKKHPRSRFHRNRSFRIGSDLLL